MTSAAIEVSNVSKTFRLYRPDRPFMLQEVLARGIQGLRATERFWALRDVSFSVPRGCAAGIIGANGSGKSTLLRLVGGIGSVDSGRVRVAGRVGALLDLGSGLHADLTGRENVIVAGVLSGLTRREVLRRFDDIVGFAELEKFIDNPLRTYSSGMQMRLAFAINVHTNPDVLLIDEVLAVGDAAFQRKCLARIAEFKKSGCSILLVSHGVSVVQNLCDEVLWMNAGRLMAQGPIAEVVRQYEAHIGVPMEPDRAEPVTAPGAVPRRRAGERKRAVGPSVSGAQAGPVRVASVALLDDVGHPLTEFRAGNPLRVAIDFETTDGVTAPHFRVKVVREDGLVCCDVVTERSDVVTERTDPGTLVAAGPGRVTLTLDRLDLNSGHYSVDVLAHASGAPDGGDMQTPGCPLVVIGHSARESVLDVPHRWEIGA